MDAKSTGMSAESKKWVYGILAGLVAFALARYFLHWSFNGAVVLGVIVFLLIWGIWSWSFKKTPTVAEPEPMGQPVPMPQPAIAAAPIMPAPVTSAPVAPAPVTSAPVAPAPVMPAPVQPIAPEAALPAASMRSVPPPVSAEPVAAAAQPEAIVPATQPAMLAQARDNRPDDLKIIRGIGPKLEQVLHGMGVFHFDQIAAWKAAELAWVDEHLEGFRGRASRDAWVPQARVLAKGGSEAEAFAAADAMKGQ